MAAFAARAETVISQSRQFMIHASDARPGYAKVPAGSIEVIPEFLAITAERVKDAVVAELPALAGSRTAIHIGVIDGAGAESMVGVLSTRYSDAWRYEISVPRVVDEARLVKGLINVLLLEYANRGAERGAELPAWVTEGFAQQLQHSVGPKLVVGRAPTAWEASTPDLHHWTREMLRTNTAPTFQELTTVAVPARKSEGEPIYLAGTHLLVLSLLEAQNGRQNFAKFLQSLPRTWNWQTALMQGYGFARMLDVEKWWALTVIEFTTRDQRQAWSAEMSLRKLDELLLTRLEVRSATNALPEVRGIELRDVLSANDASLQRDAVNEKISQLSYTAPHMAPQVAALALEYKAVLESVTKRPGIKPTLRTTPEAQKQASLSDTLRRLAALDQKRRLLAERTVTAR